MTVVNTTTLSFADDFSFICPECNQRVDPIDFYDPFKRVTRKLPGTCPCQIARREEEKRQREEAQRSQRVRELREAAQLGRYEDSTFDNFRPRPGTEQAVWECKRFVNEFPRETGVLITGTYGNGKSRLAGAVTNHLLAKGYSCLFRNVLHLLNDIKATWNADNRDREWRIMNDLKTADLLILDDLGAHKWTEWREDTLYEIIDSRYGLQRPIVATTNCSLEELEDRLGGRTFDRLKEMCLIVENTAESYRQVIARERVESRRKRA